MPMLAQLAVIGLHLTATGPSPQEHFNRGMQLMQTEGPGAARVHFKKVQELAPDWALGHLYFAIAELELEPASSAALDALETAHRLHPGNPRITYYLGVARQRAGKHGPAADSFSATLELRPGFRDAGFLLALALRDSQRPEEAAAQFERVIRRAPNNIAALASLAEIYEGLQRHNQAEVALRRIARIQPDVAYHRYRLAQFFDRIGEKKKAHRALRRANEIDPRPERKMRPLRPSRK